MCGELRTHGSTVALAFTALCIEKLFCKLPRVGGAPRERFHFVAEFNMFDNAFDKFDLHVCQTFAKELPVNNVAKKRVKVFLNYYFYSSFRAQIMRRYPRHPK